MPDKPDYSNLESFLESDGTKAVTEGRLRDYLVGKAGEDEAFRKALVADPLGTVEAEAGVKMPVGIALHVHEEDQNSLHLVLPAPMQLDASQLQSVAGGWGPPYTSVDDPDIDNDSDDPY